MSVSDSEMAAKIKAFILEEFLPGEDASQLDLNTPLMSSGVLDSIATLKLVTFLEHQFGVAIEAHEANVDYLDSIEKIAELVRSKAA